MGRPGIFPVQRIPDDDDLHYLTQLHGSDFEAVDVSGLMIDVNSGQARQSNTVTVSVTRPGLEFRSMERSSSRPR